MQKEIIISYAPKIQMGPKCQSEIRSFPASCYFLGSSIGTIGTSSFFKIGFIFLLFSLLHLLLHAKEIKNYFINKQNKNNCYYYLFSRKRSRAIYIALFIIGTITHIMFNVASKDIANGFLLLSAPVLLILMIISPP